MNNVINRIGYALFLFHIAAYLFGFWFFLLSWLWSPVAGAIAGGLCVAFFLFIVNIKRTKPTCPNANTRVAGKSAGKRRNQSHGRLYAGHHYHDQQ